MIKITALVVRRPELSHEQFMRHWVDVHAPLVNAVPGVRRYVQTHILGEHPIPAHPTTGVALDGIAELWFDDRTAFDRAMATPELAQLGADGALFIGQMTMLVTEEKVCVAG